MRFNIHNFEIGELAFQEKRSIVDYDRLHRIHRSHARFVRGSQNRVDVQESYQDVYFEVPKNKLDYLKIFVTKLNPSLKFGWLTPEYTRQKRRVYYTETATYINVMPLPIELKNHSSTYIQMYEQFQGRTDFNELDFLLSEPSTIQEVSEAQQEKRLSGREMAMFYE